ncbi:putative protein DUF4421 [Leeuwenhoekiella aestuarii]|uniref:DUF4421 family protein n=1 Tax=Leeuwenhoekiella aestuarii TaxID=2249426 RepID=UPI000FFF2EA7|nr:DUF4421 family protein [Leeuwenhoekiella aestuarii]RXG15019.1 putative protein DUF4421 [Leeuwenhoekiella aestuarii]
MRFKSLQTLKILLFLAVPASFYAQDLETLPKIISYTDQVQVKVHVDSYLENYFISGEGMDEELKLATNNDLRLTGLFDYKIFSFSYSFTPGFLPGNDDNAERGDSQYQDFTVRLFPGQFVQEFKYQRLKGFYVENTDVLFPDFFDNEGYLFFPDLKRTFYGGSTSYVLNPDFSLEGLLYQRKWQRVSAGSFVPSFNYSYARLKNDFETYTGVENNFDFSLDVSYYYNAVIEEQFNIAPYAFGGIGTRMSTYERSGEEYNDKESNTYFTTEYGAGIQVGYNTSKFLMGARLNYKSLSYTNENDTSLKDDSWYGLFFIGYRFDPPEKLRQTTERLGL